MNKVLSVILWLLSFSIFSQEKSLKFEPIDKKHCLDVSYQYITQHIVAKLPRCVVLKEYPDESRQEVIYKALNIETGEVLGTGYLSTKKMYIPIYEGQKKRIKSENGFLSYTQDISPYSHWYSMLGYAGVFYYQFRKNDEQYYFVLHYESLLKEQADIMKKIASGISFDNKN